MIRGNRFLVHTVLCTLQNQNGRPTIDMIFMHSNLVTHSFCHFIILYRHIYIYYIGVSLSSIRNHSSFGTRRQLSLSYQLLTQPVKLSGTSSNSTRIDGPNSSPKYLIIDSYERPHFDLQKERH